MVVASMGRTNWRQQPQKNLGISALPPSCDIRSSPWNTQTSLKEPQGCPTKVNWASWSQRVENQPRSDGKSLAQHWRRSPGGAGKPSQPGALQPAKATTQWKQPPAHLGSTNCNLGFHLLGNFAWKMEQGEIHFGMSKGRN